jgi:3-isopropylmalate/(R)-2-methylmalate dehydratase large subunit
MQLRSPISRTSRAPQGAAFDAAVARWSGLKSDANARFDREVQIDASKVRSSVTYGTHPGMVTTLDAPVPAAANAQEKRALAYMHVEAGKAMAGTPVDIVFLGSCTNSRLSDLRAAADVLRGRKVAASVRMLVVPGSEQIKRDAEGEGLDEVFRAAGAEWREAGCSMCLGMNGDIGKPGQLVVSTSNRNFEGRQGPGVRTVLASPLVAAASAIKPMHRRSVGIPAGVRRCMKAITHIRSRHGRAAAREHRHRSHHSGAIPDDDAAHRPKQGAVQ